MPPPNEPPEETGENSESVGDPAPGEAEETTADAAPSSPAAALVMRYLAAAATLDPSATRPFLSATCQGDLVTEFIANVVFQGGTAFIAKQRTFFLAMEDGEWRISEMDPAPRTTGPGFVPLSR